MDIVQNARDKVKKYARWIPISKYRRDFRNTILDALDKSQYIALGQYANLITPPPIMIEN